jgi:hypothetical protein|tara:strand:+ start:47 stop:364 length:318 start_codon:yes stop_codon:yes gene_type:complete
MAKQLGEGTNVGVDLDGDGKSDFNLTFKTVGIIVAAVFTLGSMYVTLQSDIAEAKLLPPAEVSKKEYELNQQWDRDNINMLKEEIKDLKIRIEEVDRKLYGKKDK